MDVNIHDKPKKVVSLSKTDLNKLHQQLEDLEDEEAEKIKETVNNVIDELLDARLDKELPAKNSDYRAIINLVDHRNTLSKVNKPSTIMQVRNSVLHEIELMQAAAQTGGRRRRRKTHRRLRKSRINK